jgi:hypothetical protein
MQETWFIINHIFTVKKGLNALLTPQVSQLCDFGPPNFNCAILVPHFYPLLHLEVPHFDFDLFLNKKY